MLDLSIKINEQKSEKLKLNFDLTECTSIKEISEYFIAGCIKQMVEQVSPVNKIILTNPTFQLTDEILKMHKDLSVMLGGKAEKDQAQEIIQKKALEVKGRKKGLKNNSTRTLTFKPTQPFKEDKKFEFVEYTSSQELSIDEKEEELINPSTSSAAATSREEEEEPVKKKPKKFNVIF